MSALPRLKNATKANGNSSNSSTAIVNPVCKAVQQWRYLMFRDGLIKPVAAIHFLHGLEISYAIKPTAIVAGNDNARLFYPAHLDVVTLYSYLLKCELSLKALADANIIKSPEIESADDTNLTVEQIDRVMTLAVSGSSDSGLEVSVLEQLLAATSQALNELAFIEGAGDLDEYGDKAVMVLAYLALYRDGKQTDRVIELNACNVTTANLGAAAPAQRTPTELTPADRNTYLVTVGRLNERLRERLQAFAAASFGRRAGIVNETVDFVSKDRLTSITRLNAAMVWVDGWQLDEIATRYRCSVTRLTGLRWLETAYKLVQASLTSHSYGVEANDASMGLWGGIAALDDYATTCLNILGVFGDRLNRKLELLEQPSIEAKCEYFLNLWYSINLKLAAHYQAQPTGLSRTIEHLAQCQLTRPDEPEPVLQLLRLTQHYGDYSKFNRVYRHYKKCCQEIEMEPDEEVQAFYEQVIAARRQQATSTTFQSFFGGNSNERNTVGDDSYYYPTTPSYLGVN